MKGRKAVSKNTMIYPHYAKGTKKAEPPFSKMNIYVVMWKKIAHSVSTEWSRYLSAHQLNN